jgi:Lon protease-like protein
MARFYSLNDLPPVLGNFPLTGALLLPRGQLPLNVFEPRYLALVDDAMSGTRLIGMIQPTEAEDKTLTPPLSAVGCVGRITSYRESDDGRYLITLSGLCRFASRRNSRRERRSAACAPDYAPFAADLATVPSDDFPRERLLTALKDYLSRRDLNADWHSVMSAPAETLVNALAMLCPFRAGRKTGAARSAGLAGACRYAGGIARNGRRAPAPGGSTLN